MDEKDLILLTELMRSENITRTAERLFTTQPAVTKRLKQIEADLGCELFVRTKRGVIPTPDAEVILPMIQNLADTMEHIRSYAASIRGEISGTLKIGIAVNYARFRLPDILTRFHEQYPKIDLRIQVDKSPDLYRKLNQRDLNIVIIRGNYPWSEGDLILSEEPVYAVSSHAANLQDLRAAAGNYIGRDVDPEFTAELDSWRRRYKLDAERISLMVNDVETMVAILNKGIGWAILPELCLQNFKGHRIPLCHNDGTPLLRHSHILYRNHYFQLPQVQRFVGMLQAAELQHSD